MSKETSDMIQAIIANNSNSKVVFSHKRDLRKLGRGNPLLSRKRFSSIQEINKKLDLITK